MIKARWEYKVILSHGISDERTIAWEAELNRYGTEGWELVSVIVRPEVPSYEDTDSKALSNPRGPRTAIFLKRERIPEARNG
jgi:hypothetical protein